MRIVILGASGQIGSVIYRGLKHDHEVVGTSRNHSVEYLRFDPFKDNWSALGITDVLINAAGQIEASAASSFHHIHVGLTELILKNRETIGRPRIVQISALGASRNHAVEFLRTKGIADDLLLMHADTIVLRPSIVCTPRTMLVKKMLMVAKIARYSLGTLLVPKHFLQTRIQPVMPQDLVDIVHALCTGGKENVITIAGPDRISFGEIIATMNATLERRFRMIEVPRALADRMMNQVVFPLFPRMINAQQYNLLFEDNIDDSRAIERILNRTPQSVKQFFINEFSNARN